MPALHLVISDAAEMHDNSPTMIEAVNKSRWIVALISDTGMRLSEAAGIHINDLHLNEEIPYVDIRQHPWRRLC